MINIAQEQANIGDRYEVYSVGEELIDPDTGESLGAIEERLGMIEIVRVKPKYAEAEPRGNLKINDLQKGMIVRPEDKTLVQRKEREQKQRRTQEFESRF